MTRFEIIEKIGSNYHTGNTETGEFSYVQALRSKGKDIKDYLNIVKKNVCLKRTNQVG